MNTRFRTTAAALALTAALGLTLSACSTASKDVPERQDTAGKCIDGTVVVAKNKTDVTVAECDTVIVNGELNRTTLTGTVKNLVIEGDGNMVSGKQIDNLRIEGANADVSFTGKKPKTTDNGKNSIIGGVKQ